MAAMGWIANMNSVVGPRYDPSAADNAHESGESLPTWKIVSWAAIAAALVSVVGWALDWILVVEREPRFLTLEFSDALGGLIAGILVFRLLQYERERRQRLRQKIAVIADMNHHVRNALQVITFHAASSADQEQMEAIKGSMERIQWALKEVLPKL